MINRLVKLHLQSQAIGFFQKLFKENFDRITAFEGCQHLELWQDVNRPNLFFTYSIWDSEEHLEAYRNSSLFKDIWTQVKPNFEEKAEAWSVQ